MLQPGGNVVSLIKPHYEAPANLLRGGVLIGDAIENILKMVKLDFAAADFEVLAITPSPLKGTKGNIEFLAHLRPNWSQGHRM